MSQTEPVAELNESFSEPGATAPPWTDVTDVLTASEMFWLSTVRRDGRPHVTPLPAIWPDGTLYFCTGSHEQKSANLRANPGCVLTTGSSDLRSGLDVVVEGTAPLPGYLVSDLAGDLAVLHVIAEREGTADPQTFPF